MYVFMSMAGLQKCAQQSWNERWWSQTVATERNWTSTPRQHTITFVEGR